MSDLAQILIKLDKVGPIVIYLNGGLDEWLGWLKQHEGEKSSVHQELIIQIETLLNLYRDLEPPMELVELFRKIQQTRPFELNFPVHSELTKISIKYAGQYKDNKYGMQHRLIYQLLKYASNYAFEHMKYNREHIIQRLHSSALTLSELEKIAKIISLDNVSHNGLHESEYIKIVAQRCEIQTLISKRRQEFDKKNE